MRLLLFLTTLIPLPSFAASYNVTIDDQYGDPTNGLQIVYNPPSAWQKGQTCADCTAKVTPANDAWMGTWMDATYNPSESTTNKVPGQIIQASLSFTGVAVYVNVILTGTIIKPIANTDYTFFLDDKLEDVFGKSPNGNSTYLFNQTVFSRVGLNNTLHTLRIESGHLGKTALVLLDSIIYTTDGGSSESISTTSDVGSAATAAPVVSASSSSSHIGAIVGPTVAVVVIFGVILAFLYRRRHRKYDINNHYNHPEIRSSSYPNCSDHMFKAGVRPYSITSEDTDTFSNMSSSYPSTMLSHQTMHQISRNSANLPHLSGSHLRMLSPDITSPPYTHKIPRRTAQMWAVTELDISVSGSEISSPTYIDDDGGPSPNVPIHSSIPLPRYKN